MIYSLMMMVYSIKGERPMIEASRPSTPIITHLSSINPRGRYPETNDNQEGDDQTNITYHRPPTIRIKGVGKAP
jgi:hypothetical protein